MEEVKNKVHFIRHLSSLIYSINLISCIVFYRVGESDSSSGDEGEEEGEGEGGVVEVEVVGSSTSTSKTVDEAETKTASECVVAKKQEAEEGTILPRLPLYFYDAFFLAANSSLIILRHLRVSTILLRIYFSFLKNFINSFFLRHLI